MNLRFDGKVIAGSGAGHGVGQALSEGFARPGAPGFGCNLVPATVAGTEMAVVDLTDRAAGAAWIGHVERTVSGPVDVLVNNAGGVAGQAFRPVEEVTDADWDRILAVNLGAAFALSR